MSSIGALGNVSVACRVTWTTSSPSTSPKASSTSRYSPQTNTSMIGCEITPIEDWPAPAQPLTAIGPGTYLVGRDIAPGTYRGKAGSRHNRLVHLATSQLACRVTWTTSSPSTSPKASSLSTSRRPTTPSRPSLRAGAHAVNGSIRQRSPGSWQLTVDLGRDVRGRRRRKPVLGMGVSR